MTKNRRTVMDPQYYSLDPFSAPRTYTVQFQFQNLLIQRNTNLLNKASPKDFSSKKLKAKQKLRLNESIDFLSSTLVRAIETLEKYQDKETELRCIDDFTATLERLLDISLKYNVNAKSLYGMLGKRVAPGSESWTRVLKSLHSCTNNLGFSIETFLDQLEKLENTINASLENVITATDRFVSIIEMIINIPIIEKTDQKSTKKPSNERGSDVSEPLEKHPFRNFFKRLISFKSR